MLNTLSQHMVVPEKLISLYLEVTNKMNILSSLFSWKFSTDFKQTFICIWRINFMNIFIILIWPLWFFEIICILQWRPTCEKIFLAKQITWIKCEIKVCLQYAKSYFWLKGYKREDKEEAYEPHCLPEKHFLAINRLEQSFSFSSDRIALRVGSSTRLSLQCITF